MGPVSLAELAERYRPEILAYLVRLMGNAPDAQDACQEAFEACHWAVDRIKETVPVWKKEYFEGGAVWVDGGFRQLHELAGHRRVASDGVRDRQP